MQHTPSGPRRAGPPAGIIAHPPSFGVSLSKLSERSSGKKRGVRYLGESNRIDLLLTWNVAGRNRRARTNVEHTIQNFSPRTLGGYVDTFTSVHINFKSCENVNRCVLPADQIDVPPAYEDSHLSLVHRVFQFGYFRCDEFFFFYFEKVSDQEIKGKE